MAAPSQINTLRATDFPSGLASKQSTDKLFQILNPFLQQVGQTTTAGTSLGSNIDGQFAQVAVSKGSAWLPMTLTSPFAIGTFGGNWPIASYRVDGTGRLWLRGLVIAASAPTSGQAIWVYPKGGYGPSNGVAAAGKLFAMPTLWADGTSMMARVDAYIDKLVFTPTGTSFPTGGNTTPTNLTLGTSVIGALTYTRDGSGWTHIEGNIGTSGSVASGITIGTLPAGYRPTQTCACSATIQSSAVVYSAAIMTITTGGLITLNWSSGNQQINACGITGISFFSFTPSTTLQGIIFASLDGMSWDTKGGTTLSTRPSFPLNIRLKDGKKPVVVICWAVNDDSTATEACSLPSWSYNGTGNTGNTLTINSVNDLREDQGYTLNFFIFY